MLANIEHITPTMPVDGEKEVQMNISDKSLTNIPEETTIDTELAMEVVNPAFNPSVYLNPSATLPGPLLIGIVTATSFVPLIPFSQQFILDQQSKDLATAPGANMLRQ
uniref:Uncharacterized protein n=1 Tax=Romanomermis culicivorax TaxID=13658 RepID=A0A915K5G0_ROMCU